MIPPIEPEDLQSDRRRRCLLSQASLGVIPTILLERTCHGQDHYGPAERTSFPAAPRVKSRTMEDSGFAAAAYQGYVYPVCYAGGIDLACPGSDSPRR